MDPQELAQLAMFADTAGGPDPASINSLGGPGPGSVQMLPTSQPGLPGVDPGALSRGVDFALSDTSKYTQPPQATEPPGEVPDDLPHPTPSTGPAPTEPPGPVDHATLPHPAPGQSVSASRGGSVSVSQSGYSQAKHDQISRGPGSEMERQLAASDAAVAGKYAPYQERAAALADQERAAQELVTKREAELLTAKADGDKQVADLYAEYKNFEEGAYAKARADAEKAKADYRAALLAIPQVNTGQFYENLGPVGMAGLMTGGFIAGFLKAGGIDTGFDQQIENGIRRNIEGQIANINTKGKVAAGFKDLWDMTRAQSASDAEAREKMYGFGLNSLKAKIQSELGKYDSNLHAAKGQQALAALTDKQLQSDLKVQEYIDRAQNERARELVDFAKAKLHAAVEHTRIAVGAREAAANRAHAIEMEKLKGEQGGLDQSDYIVDSTKSGDNEFRWKFRSPRTDPETKRNVKTKIANTAVAVGAMNELIELQAKADAVPPGFAKSQMLNELQRRERALRTIVVNAIVLDNSGKAVTDKEFQRYIDSIIPQNGWFTNGDNRAVISQELAHKQEEANALLVQWADPVAKGDSFYGRKVPKTRVGEAERVAADIAMSPNQGKDDPESPVNKQVQAALAPDASATVSKPSEGLLQDWRAVVKAHPEVVNEDRFIPGPDVRQSDTPLGKYGSMGEDARRKLNSAVPTKEFEAVYELAVLALKDPAAKAKLQEWASSEENPAEMYGLAEGNDDKADLRIYAQYYLDQLK